MDAKAQYGMNPLPGRRRFMSSLTIYLAMLMLGSNCSSSTVAQDPTKQQVAKVEQPLTQPKQDQAAQPLQQPVPKPPVLQFAPKPAEMSTSKSQTVVTESMTDDEKRFVDLINYERRRIGLKPLRIDPLLVEVSRGHSKEMADKDYFDHISPTPGLRTALDRYFAAVKRRPSWALVGENLFYCSIIDINRGHTCLMESVTHRDNILNPRFERVGVGIYTNENGEFWVTQMFLAATD